MYTENFYTRHLGPQKQDTAAMLKVLGLSNLDELIQKVVPASIHLSRPLDLPPAVSEQDYAKEIQEIASENQVFTNYIGQGYYNCTVPPVIQRNIFENPGWYTAYTPYQAEVSQGRLESLFHFQTMVVELTGMEVANASLLDEATAAAEAMTMLYRRSAESVAKTFFVSQHCFVQTIELIRLRAEPLGIEIEVGDESRWQASDKYFGILLQYLNHSGEIKDYGSLITEAKAQNIAVGMAADLLALSLLQSPGSLGADVVIGSSQRFGVPLGYGGPHAAYFATRKAYQRLLPGRLVGLSKDRLGQEGYRLALQTREQHIRREKATSNICTAQALLAIMAAMYAIYHGPEGLRRIALGIHNLTVILEEALRELGFTLLGNGVYFDTLHVDISTIRLEELRQIALANKINLHYVSQQSIVISLDETTSPKDIEQLVAVFAQAAQKSFDFQGHWAKWEKQEPHSILRIPQAQLRSDNFLSQEIFHSYHSETAMMRYIRRLEEKDLALNQGMIPLGSCTMKLNPASAMIPLSLPQFTQLHPFAPLEQAEGYLRIFKTMETYLSEITGMDATCLQPNSGAQGEFSGLMVIRAYHRDHGQEQRDVALIPASAHGTNPSSASMAGMEVVVVACGQSGEIDLQDLKQKAQALVDRLACIMITYPSTHGVFEENIQEVCQIVHDHGGLVYLDGANMNAQVGLANPRIVGADVCHLNLHKTFSIPHGGGGPGVGPICVTRQLMPYLPGHALVGGVGGKQSIGQVAAAPWGSANILLVSYAYLRLLGAEGMELASRYAILNANYMKKRLEDDYEILYADENGYVAHEMILDLRGFRSYGIGVEDVAKRLVDYGFHAPTMSWPVAGTLMIEPTESEPKEELDRFCAAMLKIRTEIEDIVQTRVDASDNVLKNSPHPPQELITDEWSHPYSRQQAAYPVSSVAKFWPPVARIDDAYGDRNLVCSCPQVSEYSLEALSTVSH